MKHPRIDPAADDVESAGRTHHLVTRTRLQWAGLVGGPVIALSVHALLAANPTAAAELSSAGRAAAAVGVWMAVWWLTEAVDLPVTALLPVLLFPLTGVASIEDATAPYANEMIFLFLGGFILALSMQRWELDQRIALLTLRLVGDRPDHILAGFMGATAVMSMWVSNTATVAMMVPIAIGVSELVAQLRREATPGADGDRRFTVALLLGVAYSASIGGMGTIIGTPPNLFVVSFIRGRFGIDVGFVEWMVMAVPLVAVFLPLGWFLLGRVLYPVGRDPIPGAVEMVQERYRRLGRPTPGEIVTVVVFFATATAWITRPLLVEWEVNGGQPFAGLTDTGIAVAAAVALFVIPVDVRKRTFTMDWPTARRLPWGILLLFGGGLSLAAAIDATGLSDFLGGRAEVVAGLAPWVVVGTITTLVVALTELTSNTATTATLVPILAGIAPGLGIDPLLMVVPVALAASAAFMMPVATPPNAIVFASGQLTIPQMVRAGIWMNLASIVLITATTMLLVPRVLGV